MAEITADAVSTGEQPVFNVDAKLSLRANTLEDAARLLAKFLLDQADKKPIEVKILRGHLNIVPATGMEL